jgi:hypothetical protein
LTSLLYLEKTKRAGVFCEGLYAHESQNNPTILILGGHMREYRITQNAVTKKYRAEMRIKSVYTSEFRKWSEIWGVWTVLGGVFDTSIEAKMDIDKYARWIAEFEAKWDVVSYETPEGM